MNTRRITTSGLALATILISGPLFGQNRIRFAGRVSAIDYAYGVNAIGLPGPLVVDGGPYVVGSQSITVQYGYTTAGDGTVINPLATNAPVIVGGPTNQETVTPTAVSCSTPAVYDSCTFTATFANAHGRGESIISGTYGAQEAINSLAKSGGLVVLSPAWASTGGTAATIALLAPLSNVGIEDLRAAPYQYFAATPSTLTTISAPTTLVSGTASYSGTGTWSTSAYFPCITYVDILGGESACSGSFSLTPGGANMALNIVAPAASTGAVGWRAYAGTSAVTSAYLLPITSANCTLTTLESVMPACAMGASGVFPTLFVTTTSLAPGALGVTNTNNPVPQSHTTFAYQASATLPVPFQTNFGPFGSGTIASATASDLTPLGSFQLPAGYLNQIGRVVRISGKISLTAGASSTLSIQSGMAWVGGVTAGLPLTVCNSISGVVWATHAYTDVNFTCTMTVNAVGVTAVGSLQPESTYLGAYATATVTPIGTDTSAAAIASLGLFAQDTFTISILPLVAADTTVQLVSLHIETLQ